MFLIVYWIVYVGKKNNSFGKGELIVIIIIFDVSKNDIYVVLVFLSDVKK